MCMCFSDAKLDGFREVEKVLELPTDTSCLEFRGKVGKQRSLRLLYICMVSRVGLQTNVMSTARH